MVISPPCPLNSILFKTFAHLTDENRASLSFPLYISQPWPPASPRAFLLPHGLKLSVFDVRELRRAQTALHTVSCSGKPFLLHPQTEAGHRGSLDLYLVAGGLESVEERQREGRQTVGDGD